ncbi:hypothetical protein BC629DRAFT_1448788 [Irpex lacteus]|nr:hypothetical protein BC629DRAFT_1448788 [Irpex lacteus]
MGEGNGWIDPIVQTMSEPVADSSGQINSIKLKTPLEMQAAVADRRLADLVSTVKGSYAPSLAAMQEELSVPETSVSVKEKIEELKARHVTEMQHLHDILAEEYLAERVDTYLSKDDAINVEEIENYCMSLANRQSTARIEARDALFSFLYVHNRTLLTLLRRQASLAYEEEQARRKRDAQFPGSALEWRAIKDKDIQARIGRFLGASPVIKERMLEEFGWAYRQVRPLEEEYTKNIAFMAEAQRTVRDYQGTQDPRRKSQG